MIYIICFVASGTFIFLSEQTKGYIQKILVCVGLLIPSVLAGVRGFDVGTDINFYGRQVFNTALTSSGFFQMAIWNQLFGIEFGYLFLNYVITRFTDNIAWLFFFIELFILVLTYQALKYYKRNYTKETTIAYMLLIYYFLFYNDSLNLMRQSMAAAVVLYAFRYIYNREPMKYVLCIILAMQFHITALLAVFLYPLYFSVKIKKIHQINIILFVVALLSGPILGGALKLIINTGMFGSKFLKYVDVDSGMGLNLNQLIIRIPFIIILWYLAYRQKNKKSYDYFLISVLLCDLAFAELRGVTLTLTRLSLYFSIYKCFAYPEITAAFVRENRRWMRILLLTFVVVLWFYQVVLMDNGETFPYMINSSLDFFN